MLYTGENSVQRVAKFSQQHRRLRCQADKRNQNQSFVSTNKCSAVLSNAGREPRACKKGIVNGVQEGEEVVRKQEQETLDRDTAAKKAEADAKRRQREAAHNDAVAAFQTLLAETVKESSARWQVGILSALDKGLSLNL